MAHPKRKAWNAVSGRSAQQFTIALAVEALSDDKRLELWSASDFQVCWTENSNAEVVWLRREDQQPLVSFSVKTAREFLALIESLPYGSFFSFGDPQLPDMAANDMVAFVLGARSCLATLAELAAS
jgi:hypothetical protein